MAGMKQNDPVETPVDVHASNSIEDLDRFDVVTRANSRVVSILMNVVKHDIIFLVKMVIHLRHSNQCSTKKNRSKDLQDHEIILQDER